MARRYIRAFGSRLFTLGTALVTMLSVALVHAAPASAAVQPPKYFIFDNVHSQMCLDLSIRTSYGEPQLVQSICDRSWWQQWERLDAYAKPVDNAYWFEFVNRANHHCLDVADSSLGNGAAVISGYCDGGDSQRWKMELTSSYGVYVLRNLKSRKVLEIYGISKSYRAPAVQWDCWWGPNQRWYGNKV